MKKVKVWCDVNKLSINFSKTNFMIVKSRQKRDSELNIRNENVHFSSILERKDRIKHLGALLEETVSFRHHIYFMFVLVVVCIWLYQNLKK